MTTPSFALFDTPIGHCGLVWGERGLIGASLPESSAGATRARIRRRYAQAREAAPPADVQLVIARIVRLLNGEADDLMDIALDMSTVPGFNRRVYDIARHIGPGTTRTYGEIAVQLGEPHAAREVGQALGANPFPIIVPGRRRQGRRLFGQRRHAHQTASARDRARTARRITGTFRLTQAARPSVCTA
jgi:methylated-DNA-[protein]-cysteine S-methyltransferase